MPDPIAMALAACLAAGASRGICMADAKMGEIRQIEVEVPSWATTRWQEYAAHIVASEARNVPSADIVIACALIDDVERGWHPWGLYPGRWHGYGTPDAADRRAVADGLLTGICDDIPEYKFVGNLHDLRHWHRTGVVGDGPFDIYLGRGDSAVVGVPYNNRR